MSLKNALPDVYNALYEHSGYQKLNAFLDVYCLHDPDTHVIREMYGERAMSELTPQILTDGDHPIWRKHIPFDRLTMPMQQALLDPDLHAVIQEAEPGYDFNPQQPTLGLLARVPIIQQIALIDQMGHAKIPEFTAYVDTLNNEKMYKKVVSDIERLCPDLLPYLSQKHYKFRLDIESKKIVKNTASIWRKANDYPPNDENEGTAGTLGVKDSMRMRLIPDIPSDSDEDFTFQQYTAMRNQILAYQITGQIDFLPTRMKDNVSKTIENGGVPYAFPSCNINGFQDYTFHIKNKQKLIGRFMSEIQFVPMNKKVRHYVDATLPSRDGERAGNEENAIIRQGQLQEMWTKMPHLYKAAMGQYEDPSGKIIERYINQTQYSPDKVLSKRKSYKPTKLVNLSQSNDMMDLAKGDARIILDEMIRQYPDNVIQQYRDKKMQQYRANTSSEPVSPVITPSIHREYGQ